MSAMPRCFSICLLAAVALLVLPAAAEVSIGKTYSGDVSKFVTLVTFSTAAAVSTALAPSLALRPG